MAGWRSTERSKIRLQAVQIAANLPENPHLALKILEAAYTLIRDGMDGEEDASALAGKVVKFRR
jgi:hypothetical protein